MSMKICQESMQEGWEKAYPEELLPLLLGHVVADGPVGVEDLLACPDGLVGHEQGKVAPVDEGNVGIARMVDVGNGGVDGAT